MLLHRWHVVMLWGTGLPDYVPYLGASFVPRNGYRRPTLRSPSRSDAAHAGSEILARAAGWKYLMRRVFSRKFYANLIADLRKPMTPDVDFQRGSIFRDSWRARYRTAALIWAAALLIGSLQPKRPANIHFGTPHHISWVSVRWLSWLPPDSVTLSGLRSGQPLRHSVWASRSSFFSIGKTESQWNGMTFVMM